MPDHHYLFIDGGYLRARHSDIITRVFGETARLNLALIRNLFPGSAFQRVFYYDCLHDIPKVNESEEDLRARIKSQQDFFDELQSLEGFHVRLGSLSGSSRKLRQKEVDILLAVEALDHAFRKNMVSVTLLAGDLDFAPLVEALVRLGTWVEIWHDPKSAAKHLLEAADKALPLGFEDYYNWCDADFKQTHVLPLRFENTVIPPKDTTYNLLKTGTFKDKEIRLYSHENEQVFFIPENVGSWTLVHTDGTVLENYFNVIYSPITWK